MSSNSGAWLGLIFAFAHVKTFGIGRSRSWTKLCSSSSGLLRCVRALRSSDEVSLKGGFLLLRNLEDPHFLGSVSGHRIRVLQL